MTKIDEMKEEFWYNHIYPLLNRLWAMEIEYLLPDQTEEEFKQEMKADLQEIVDKAVREKIDSLLGFIPDGWKMPLGWGNLISQIKANPRKEAGDGEG